MSVKITGVDEGSIAEECGIEQGDTLVSINGNDIIDVLDYRFYMTDENLLLRLVLKDGTTEEVDIEKDEYEDIGLEFESYLMDKQTSCRNKCIFCFIDQTPPGMRESLYFKDDDARLSFLFGNYITLTNLKQKDIDRIIKLKISPVNISVHTTNEELRCKMMGNRFAGECLKYIKQIADAGTEINTQLVLCPEINDGKELEKSIKDLSKMFPSIKTISCVPVGVTKYRENLFNLRPYTKQEAIEVINIIEGYAETFYKQYGKRFVFASDEFYLTAEKPLPDYEYYGDFAQLENGVGLLRLLDTEFFEAIEEKQPQEMKRKISIATGKLAYPFIDKFAKKACEKFHGLDIQTFEIKNEFYGETITVAGLITGQDIINQLKGKDLGEELLLPRVMLRNEGDVFLDDITPRQIEEQLNTNITFTENDGYFLLDAMLGN
ncbi:MAG: DUF512 domain-containing protein [Oscillospiraceae bacterium]